MRRSKSLIGVVVVLLAIAAARFYPDLKRRQAEPHRDATPVSVPGAAPIEGPYFSDRDRVAERIIAAINHTRRSLHIAVYALTHADIASAIESAAQRGVEVRIVSDQRQANEPSSEISFLRSKGVAIRLSRGYKGDRSIMHNKFAVFDGRLAVTGSFNWTTSADHYNFENAVFISDPAGVARFEVEFERIWAQAR
ncbi:MAG: phospholipase D-like domain-containing protein [Terriglobia bacterium]